MAVEMEDTGQTYTATASEEDSPPAGRRTAVRERRIQRPPRLVSMPVAPRAAKSEPVPAQITYAAVCCRTGCTWQTKQVIVDKLEAIRAGREHEAERQPELHITTVVHIDTLLRAAA